MYQIKADQLRIEVDADLRSTVYELIYGSETEMPRGQWVVVQRLVRDIEGNAIKSPYTYKLTGEGRHNDRGPATTRTGYLCNEVLVRTIFRPASRMIMDEATTAIGVQVPTRDVCYFSFKDEIKENDVIVFIKLDIDGNIIQPVGVDREVNITKVYPKNLDGGRLEYYATIVEDQK